MVLVFKRKKLRKYSLLCEKYVNFHTFRGYGLLISGYIKSIVFCLLSSPAFKVDKGRFVARRGPISVKWEWMNGWMDGWNPLFKLNIQQYGLHKIRTEHLTHDLVI